MHDTARITSIWLLSWEIYSMFYYVSQMRSANMFPKILGVNAINAVLSVLLNG